MKQTFTDRVRAFFHPIIFPIVKFLAKLNIHPNLITILGTFGFIIVAILIAKGKFFLAGIGIIVFGTLDTIDGTLARYTKKESKFGAFLDSTLDRYAEIFLFLGFIYYFLKNANTWGVLLSFLAITGSFMVSYTRARAEGVGFECKIGLFTRFERLAVLTISLFFNLHFYIIALLAFFTHFTALQRIFYVYNTSKKYNKGS